MRCVLATGASAWAFAPHVPSRTAQNPAYSPYAPAPTYSAYAPGAYAQRLGEPYAYAGEPYAPIERVYAYPEETGDESSPATWVLAGVGLGAAAVAVSQRRSTPLMTTTVEAGAESTEAPEPRDVSQPLEFSDGVGKIVDAYLKAKYDRAAKEVPGGVPSSADLRRSFADVLPPLPERIFESELTEAMASLPNRGKVEYKAFREAVLSNRDWRESGELVVLEVIYMDCIYNFYSGSGSVLKDESYDALKEALFFEGSEIPTLSMDEAKFITAVQRFHRGEQIMPESAYDSLKKKLKEQNSWVVQRAKGAQEQMGMKTFMSYLHLGLTADAGKWEIPDSLAAVRAPARVLRDPRDTVSNNVEAFLQEQIKAKSLIMKTYMEEEESPPEKKKKGGLQAEEGIFSPAVRAARFVLGAKNLNKIRGKAITLHSQTITRFCTDLDLSSNTRGNLIKVAKVNGDFLGFLV